MKKSSLPSRRQPLARSKIKRKARKPSETLRIYGPPARREFVKSLPCAACGVVGYSENAHLLGNGGMSRKADADTIGPLCGPRSFRTPAGRNWFVLLGCHETYDNHRSHFNSLYPDFNPEQVAAQTEKAWQEYSGTSNKDEASND